MLTSFDIIQILLYGIILFLCIKPLGLWMANVYEGERTFLSPVLNPLEKVFYRFCGINPDTEMSWKQYAGAMLSISILSFISLFLILIFQGTLPLNPQNLPSLQGDLAFNISVSFITNTNWQSYAGESTLSPFSQMVGLTVQNFISAAVGMSVLIAFIRGLSRKSTQTIGNFWVDTTRGVIYILLPLSIIWTLALGSTGVVQKMTASPVSISESSAVTQNIPPLGPVASQVAIKQLGTNGGGYYNANSAHPFENPTPLSNFLQALAILIIPASLCYTFGRMIRDTRQGWAILGAMTLIFIPLMVYGVLQEKTINSSFTMLGIDGSAGNMEGKEVRLGVMNSALWAAVTTAASNGSVNSMHDSYNAMGGFVPMLFMKFGEVIYGGVGSGLYGMLIFVILTVFIAGLMVGRTPEYLGKKIQVFEIKMASVVILIPCTLILLGTSLAVMTEAGQAGILNKGAQGFSEILYALTSASNNNGSAFAGLSANTPFYNTLLGICMLIGRFWLMIPVLAIAGSLAAKKSVPVSSGTLMTHTPLFIMMLAGIVVLVGVLTFVPALALGPVAEYLNMILPKA